VIQARKKRAMLDEVFVSAVTELRLILSYSDKTGAQTATSQTSNIIVNF